MSPRPTIKTIAKETGLSTATVSKALNGSPQVRPDTRDKILDVAKKLGYEMNLSGVQLRTGKTYQIAMISVISSPHDDEWGGVGYAQLVYGLSDVLHDTPYRVVQYQASSFEESLEIIQRIVANRKADGIILPGTRTQDARVQYMQAQGFPFVTYGLTELDTPHAYVDTHNQRIVSICVERLISKGHKRIAMLNAEAVLTYSQVRERAYRKTLEDAGLEFDENLVANDDLTPAFGRENFSRCLCWTMRPLHIFAPTKRQRSAFCRDSTYVDMNMGAMLS